MKGLKEHVFSCTGDGIVDIESKSVSGVVTDLYEAPNLSRAAIRSFLIFLPTLLLHQIRPFAFHLNVPYNPFGHAPFSHN